MDLYDGGRLIRSYKADMGSRSINAKLRSGDSATPEGRYQVTAKKRTKDAALIHWSHMSLNGKSPIGKFDGTYKPYKGIDGYFATFTPTHGRLRKNPGFNLVWENTGLKTANNKTYDIVFAVNDGKVRQYIEEPHTLLFGA